MYAHLIVSIFFENNQGGRLARVDRAKQRAQRAVPAGKRLGFGGQDSGQFQEAVCFFNPREKTKKGEIITVFIFFIFWGPSWTPLEATHTPAQLAASWVGKGMT